MHALPDESIIDYDTPFKLKNSITQKYLTLSFDEDQPLIHMQEATDENDQSQYFRFKISDSGEPTLNNAVQNATFFISPNTENPESEEVFIDSRDSAHITPMRNEDGSVKLLTQINDNSYFLTAESDDTAKFKKAPDMLSDWIIEYVTPSAFEFAYFQTRVKIYSIDKLSLNIQPAALSSFVTWSVDDEDVLLVANDGTFCALREGKANITASLGNTSYTCSVEVSEKEAFTWFSQTNVSNSYWNGSALDKLKFKNKPLVSSTSQSWMDDGCAISSLAMVLHNMHAVYVNGYDFRSGQNGNLPADPYTVMLANIGHSGFESNFGNYNIDPVYTRWTTITDAFAVNGQKLTYTHKYSGNPNTIKNALLSNPEGIIVEMSNSRQGTHYIVIAECLNPEETNPSKLKFIVYDPLSNDGSDGDGVLFEDSASYAVGYRYTDFESFYYWDTK